MVDVYGCLPLAFARGHGAYLYDADGNRYLDFFCGLAVTSLGHGNPRVVRAIKEQAEKLTHVSNVFHTEPTARLVERLANHFGDGKVFLGNSGAEANEAAIKLARRWGSSDGGGRFEILATLGSFHGRTLATLSATGQERYHQGFQPLMPGFRLVPFDDLAALDRALRDETVGVMVEPIQGEGGVVVPRADYLKRLRDWCDRNKLLLILDEVQTGMGRTGKFFALRARRHQARYRDAGQGARRRTSDRRDDRAAGDRVELYARQSRQHLRRKSGGVRGGARRDRRPRAGRRARRTRPSVGGYMLERLAQVCADRAIESSKCADSA